MSTKGVVDAALKDLAMLQGRARDYPEGIQSGIMAAHCVACILGEIAENLAKLTGEPEPPPTREAEVYKLVERWCRRPLSVTFSWLANDAEMFAKLRDIVRPEQSTPSPK